MKTKSIFALIAFLAVTVSLTSCGGQKQVMNAGKQEIIMPFQAPANRTDMDYFRATASGTSPDLEMARTISEMNARTQLAAQVSTVIKSVAEKYAKQAAIQNQREFMEKVEQNTRQVINQTLQGATIKDTKLYQNADGTYEFWTNIEMSRVPVEEEAVEGISNDELLNLDFNQHLFREVFKEEMALEMQKAAQGR